VTCASNIATDRWHIDPYITMTRMGAKSWSKIRARDAILRGSSKIGHELTFRTMEESALVRDHEVADSCKIFYRALEEKGVLGWLGKEDIRLSTLVNGEAFRSLVTFMRGGGDRMSMHNHCPLCV